MSADAGWVISFLLINLLSTGLFSPVMSGSVKILALLVILAAEYFVIIKLIVNPRLATLMISAYIVCGVLEALYSLLGYLFAQIGINIGGWGVDFAGRESIRFVRPYGTMVEPNILGYVTTIMVLLLLPFWTTASEYRHRMRISLCLGLFTIVSILTMTRTAWIAFLLTLPVWWLSTSIVRSARGTSRGRIYKSIGLLIVVFLLAGWLFSDLIGSRLTFEEFTVIRVGEAGAGTLAVRFEGIFALLPDITERPILGTGTGSAKRLDVGYLWSREDMFVENPNLTLLILHDVGVVGLIISLGLFYWWTVLPLRALRVATDPFLRCGIEGLWLGWIALWIMCQAGHVFWLGFMWLHLGLMMAATHVAMREASG